MTTTETPIDYGVSFVCGIPVGTVTRAWSCGDSVGLHNECG